MLNHVSWLWTTCPDNNGCEIFVFDVRRFCDLEYKTLIWKLDKLNSFQIIYYEKIRDVSKIKKKKKIIWKKDLPFSPSQVGPINHSCWYIFVSCNYQTLDRYQKRNCSSYVDLILCWKSWKYYTNLRTYQYTIEIYKPSHNLICKLNLPKSLDYVIFSLNERNEIF